MRKSLVIFISAALALLIQTAATAQQQDKSELASAVYDYSINCWWRSFIVEKLMNFKVSPGCWTKLMDKDGWGVKTVNNFAYSLGDYGKAHGMGDLEAAESANNNDRMANKPRVEEMVNAMKGKVSFTLVADGIKCSDSEWDLVHRYMGTVGEFMGSGWTPRGGAAFVTLVVSPTARDVSVAINPDGQHFTVTAPADVEPAEWDSKITKGLQRGGK